MGQIIVEKLIDKWRGKSQVKNGGDDGSGTPFIPALYFSLLFKPSPTEEAQHEDGTAETEFDAHGGPDALEAERGG